MSVYSMTGYASAQHHINRETSSAQEASAPCPQLGMEIRAVNSRFLDLTFKLPEELRPFEPALRERLQQKIKRGKVEVRAQIETPNQTSLTQPSPQWLQRLQALQTDIQTWLPQARPLSVADVLKMGDSTPSSAIDWSGPTLALADQVIDALRTARQREGQRLCQMLLDHIGQLRTLRDKAAPLVPQLVAQHRQRFLERWKEAMALTDNGALPEAAQERALAEATAFAIRIDVAEEVTRLGSHLDEIEQLLHKGGEIGKRLDFLIQELHREANTLGSKSAALELTRISVDMKVLIEQMREQVQNLE